MSDEQNKVAAETPAVESTLAQQPEITPEDSKADTAIITPPHPVEPAPVEMATDEKTKDESAATEEKKVEEKVVEPITEGQLAHKGPGFLQSIFPSKKEFWLRDEPVSQEELSSYLRGEKPEISHPVVAWASQTGKGLLFFNKKGLGNKVAPGHVLALYDATDLKKQSPHEILFKIGGHEHTLKASSDNERDGWYMSLEKSVEMGKASKEEIHESEGYKEELEKLNKPHVSATAAAVASKRSQSQPGKTKDGEDAEPAAEKADKKGSKSRSQSRGVLNRLKSNKKEETAAKKEEKEEKDEVKDEAKPESKDGAKPEEENKTEEVAAAAGVAGVAGTAGAVAATEGSTEENKDSTESPVEEVKSEEKPKAAKRGSIFGKLPGFGGHKTPSVKPHELKPDVVKKDGTVVEDAPVLPETVLTERTDAEKEADKIETKAEKEVAKENGIEEPKQEVSTPSKEKSGFLSGLIPKRNRSVSPSAQLAKAESEAPKETPKETTEEAVKAEEPAAEVAATEPTTEKAIEKTEEPAKTETTPTANKRQSMLGSLGRRASKAMGMRSQKKENVAPTTESAEEAKEDSEEKPLTNGEVKSEEKTIGDVVPEAISIGHTEQPPTVTASA